jgi:hypothetical protein
MAQFFNDAEILFIISSSFKFKQASYPALQRRILPDRPRLGSSAAARVLRTRLSLLDQPLFAQSHQLRVARPHDAAFFGLIERFGSQVGASLTKRLILYSLKGVFEHCLIGANTGYLP